MRWLLWLLLTSAVLAQEAPPIVTREQWGSHPQPLADSLKQTPRLLVLHHAGVAWKPDDDARQKIVGLQLFGQKEKGWPDLPYHYLIAPSGEIFEGRDWHYRPESNTKYELDGVLNVQIWGNYEEQSLNLAQLRSLVALLTWLCREHGLGPDALTTHRDQAPGQTVCPGQDVLEYVPSLRDWVRQGLAGEIPAPALRHSSFPPAGGAPP